MKTLFLGLFLSLHSLASTLPDELKEAQKLSQIWQRMQSIGTQSRDIYAGQTERSHIITRGIPKQMSLVSARGMVFRHYTGKSIDLILKSQKLKTGITPYVVLMNGFGREIFEDVTGMFLTLPHTPPHEVGLPRDDNADYIDLELDASTPVYQIEPQIFVIPGRSDTPEWIKKLYTEYLRSGTAAPIYLETLKRIEERGGINPTFMTIKIVSYRKNGVVVEN